MNDYLDYKKYVYSKEMNYRNDTKPQRVCSNYTEFEMKIPQNRQNSFISQMF